MPAVYHVLRNVVEARDESELQIVRARDLIRAIRGNRDFSLVAVLLPDGDGDHTREYIVVDIEADGVPPHNPFGINYRERLVLCVPADAKQLVDVVALRTDFPVLMHQNQGDADAPASLCLYFEPPSAVLRTWTAQSFLARIKWWLESSARGDLHPADQPVEQLFFATKYELVLPWNFEELRNRPSQRFVVMRGAERPDQGVTLFVLPAATDIRKADTATLVELDLPAVEHGVIARNPLTAGELADVLSSRGVDLLPPLQDALRQLVGDGGVPTSSVDATSLVILIHIPIRRDASSEPESTLHRAFIVPTGTLKFGVATGALFDLDGRYFGSGGLLGGERPIDWQRQPIFAVSVLRSLGVSDFRAQSGIDDEGPSGVLVGAGSLGSAMLNFWGRSGWGRWTAIDHDHIKPHNMVRHVALACHVGRPKAEVVVELHNAVVLGASTLSGICGDASDEVTADVTNAISTAQLVVDASTTLEYPRQSSCSDSSARHMSVFVTPNGEGGVLLAEDERRTIRLRTLEAQYYRALIVESWGARHLDGNLGSFWSGASCRDISFVMPYSRVVAHACTLAEQVRLAVAQPAARARVWQRDPETGAVEAHCVVVHPERRLPFGDLELYFDTGLEEKFRALRAASLPSETGGILVGYYDFNIRALVLVDCLPAPPDSDGSPGAFERGIEGLAEAVAECRRRTAGIVGYVGEWHSHPPGHSASPSGHDLLQLVYLAREMAADGLSGIQLIVGDGDVQVLRGTSAG